MEVPRTTLEVLEIDENMALYPNMERYLSIQQGCLHSYSMDHDWRTELEALSEHLTNCQSPTLVPKAQFGDPEAILDLAIRYLSGCSMRCQSNEGALTALDCLITPGCESYVGGAISETMKAQAHSCAAKAYFEKFFTPQSEHSHLEADERRWSRPETVVLGFGQSPVKYLLLAAHHANASVELGLISPITILVGTKLRQIGSELGVDIEQTAKCGKRLLPLWRAVSRRLAEMHAEELKRQRKVDKNPSDYVCAAEGCGIRGEKKAVLRACGGRCPPDLKPHYCSTECQRKDWPRHKAICKPHSGGKVTQMSSEDKAKALQVFELADVDHEDAQEQGDSDVELDIDVGEEVPSGPGRTIDVPVSGIPGGSVQIISNSMSPEMMKEVGDAITKLSIQGRSPS